VSPLELSPGTVQALATIVAALIALAAGVNAVRGNKRMKAIEAEAARQAAERAAQTTERGQTLTDQQSSYDQLQEDVKALREELAAVKKGHAGEIADIRNDLRKSQKRERAVEGYAWDLRRYIERGEGPPPPPWPTDLEEAA
jgi:septal ring factor EnvC (AmiA/AmiB activator)